MPARHKLTSSKVVSGITCTHQIKCTFSWAAKASSANAGKVGDQGAALQARQQNDTTAPDEGKTSSSCISQHATGVTVNIIGFLLGSPRGAFITLVPSSTIVLGVSPSISPLNNH